jgi:WD40 repeat protein
MKLFKRLEINGHAGAIYTCDIQNKEYVYTGAGDKFVAKWDIYTGKQESFSIKCEQAVYKLKIIQNNSILIIGTSSGSLHIIDLKEKKELKHYIQHRSAIFEITENQFNNQFYTTDSDGNFAVWNSLTLEIILFLPLFTGKIRNIEVYENGSKIILSCQDEFIRIFDTINFNEIFSFKAHDLGVNFSKINPMNKEQLISCGKDGFLKIWNILTFELIKSIPAHNFGIYQIEFLNEGLNFITISRDKSIKLWNTSTFQFIEKIERKNGGHSHAINAISKINETEFITVGDDKRMIYWELEL